ncbi:response regulator [Pendulispora rubella]|uniref:Response regulator n=1 Tax=Pendulispora rubella TaxID=2741070 RepID=A0ABZ2LEH3_9BACT
MARRNQGRWARIGFWMVGTPIDLGRGRLILHVDDDRDTNMLYASFLRRAGFRVADARTGVQGVERALELSPALILMDLVMPITDGFEATRRLKHHRRTLHIPILILTAHAYQGPIRMAEQAGANGFLLKPVVRETLIDKIDELLAA